jgi:hypothetical protein
VSNPDISPVGFAATDHPQAPLERRRGVGWLAFGGILIVAGIAGVVFFVWQLVDPSSDPRDDAVASGRIAALSAPATQAVTFTAAVAGPYTVWVDTGGALATGTRDVIVAAANCEATLADGTTTSFRGAVQGSSVVLGDVATIGTFDAVEGSVEVACHSERFGRRALRDQLEQERTFIVTAGSPPGGWLPFVALFTAIAALILGLMALGRGWLGSLRTRVRR